MKSPPSSGEGRVLLDGAPAATLARDGPRPLQSACSSFTCRGAPVGTIYDNILQCVGRTPTVRLNHVTRGLQAEVLGKCEFLNPGGSVKDRIGVYMLEEAEARGEIRPGD